uniref:Putative ovule protein n=1 Tax=Solanum chacoense TaxID=4108 RepID=A0A0V0GFK7_SOLCH
MGLLKMFVFWENCVLRIMSCFVELICRNYVTCKDNSKSCVHKENLLILNSSACTILLTFYICCALFFKG